MIFESAPPIPGIIEPEIHMIFDGVELPRLLSIEKAAEVLRTDSATVERWIAEGTLSVLRVNGVPHVLTESIADRLGEATPSRPNQEQA
jgi:excisionase family DNA binding protein